MFNPTFVQDIILEFNIAKKGLNRAFVNLLILQSTLPSLSKAELQDEGLYKHLILLREVVQIQQLALHDLWRLAEQKDRNDLVLKLHQLDVLITPLGYSPGKLHSLLQLNSAVRKAQINAVLEEQISKLTLTISRIDPLLALIKAD